MQSVTAVIARALLVTALAASAAAAQPSATPPLAAPATPPAAPAGRWEFDLHVGLSSDPDASAGSSSLPATGSLVGGLVSASTFYVGTGAALFNQSRPGVPLTPLDELMSGPLAGRPAGLALGVRVRRRVAHRLAVEASGDFLRGTLAFTSATLSGLDTTRASYQSALEAMLRLSSEASTVTSQLQASGPQPATRAVVTGALVLDLGRSRHTVPYVLAGGGLMFHHANALAASLTGTYQLGTGSFITGRDVVAVRISENGRTPVVVIGGGVRQSLTRHLGVRLDARAHFYHDASVTLIDVTPARAVQSRGTPFPSLTAGALQFSPLGPLNAPSIVDAPAFTASGPRGHLALTAGLSYRF